MNWHEFAQQIPLIPDTEAAARREFAELLARVERDVPFPDQQAAREALGDTWGQVATFRGWTLAPA